MLHLWFAQARRGSVAPISSRSKPPKVNGPYLDALREGGLQMLEEHKPANESKQSETEAIGKPRQVWRLMAGYACAEAIQNGAYRIE
jgi:hypothetical protein